MFLLHSLRVSLSEIRLFETDLLLANLVFIDIKIKTFAYRWQPVSIIELLKFKNALCFLSFVLLFAK